MKCPGGVPDGVEINAALPLTLDDGSVVSRLDLMSKQDRISLGFYEIRPDSQPFDPQTQKRSDPIYTIVGDFVENVYTIINRVLQDEISEKVKECVGYAILLLNSRSEKYAMIQVADWPQIKREVRKYNIDATVGEAMQDSMDESALTASELSSIVTPEIAYKDAVFANRNAHISAIRSLTDVSSVVNYDFSAGWPA